MSLSSFTKTEASKTKDFFFEVVRTLAWLTHTAADPWEPKFKGQNVHVDRTAAAWPESLKYHIALRATGYNGPVSAVRNTQTWEAGKLPSTPDCL